MKAIVTMAKIGSEIDKALSALLNNKPGKGYDHADRVYIAAINEVLAAHGWDDEELAKRIWDMTWEINEIE